LALKLKISGEGHLAVATVRSNFGLTGDALGDCRKAVEYFKMAVTASILDTG
jgi:hypothetical protein